MKASDVKYFLYVSFFLLLYAVIWSNPAGIRTAGDPSAVRGGTLNLHSPEFPKSFNLFVNNAADAADVFYLVYDTLLNVNPGTLEFEPLIASAWNVSADKKVFTFTIDKRARWSDGKPVTAQDVLFTYDTIMNKSNLTSVQRLSFSRFEEPQIISDRIIRFKALTVHYNNLVTLAEMNILPKHLYEGKDFNKSFNMELPGSSGPYSLSEVKEGRYYVLARRKDYWADVLPCRRYMFNFDLIKYKIIRDNNVSFEAFKKGEFDVYSKEVSDVTPKRWVTETDSEKFKKNYIIKQKIYNHAPRGFRGLALNMRNPLFKDIRVREALFRLLDRKTITEKLLYGFYKPLTSYWPNISENREVPYDPPVARKLLRDAGYTRLDKDGYLLNGRGEKLEFTVLSRMDENREKYLTFFAESCRKAGVKVNLELTSWSTLIKKMDEYKFDAVDIAWTGTLFDDPEQLWHSRHKNETGGSDLPGYSSPQVDALIDSLPSVFSAKEREKKTRMIDKIIYNDVPYLLYWWQDYYALFYKNEFGMPKNAVSRFGSGTYMIETEIINYWWFDPARAEKLRETEKTGAALNPEPPEIYYDKIR